MNYDTALLGLANITTAPDAPWSSDRAGDSKHVKARTRPPTSHHERDGK